MLYPSSCTCLLTLFSLFYFLYPLSLSLSLSLTLALALAHTHTHTSHHSLIYFHILSTSNRLRQMQERKRTTLPSKDNQGYRREPQNSMMELLSHNLDLIWWFHKQEQFYMELMFVICTDVNASHSSSLMSIIFSWLTVFEVFNQFCWEWGCISCRLRYLTWIIAHCVSNLWRKSFHSSEQDIFQLE